MVFRMSVDVGNLYFRVDLEDEPKVSTDQRPAPTVLRFLFKQLVLLPRFSPGASYAGFVGIVSQGRQ